MSLQKMRNPKKRIQIMSRKSNTPVSLPSMDQIEAEMNKINYKSRFLKTLLSTISVLVVVAAAAVLLSTLLFPVVQVSGDSMEPTFTSGDILVLVKTKEISYGDLCCASWQNKTLLKRVIGMPGDSINIDSEGNVYVNDKLLDEPYVKEKSFGKCELELPCQVPDNKYFFLGDQRGNSSDSRNPDVGCIAEDQIIGKVVFKVWPLK